jgi:hypothetical protein
MEYAASVFLIATVSFVSAAPPADSHVLLRQLYPWTLQRFFMNDTPVVQARQYLDARAALRAAEKQVIVRGA